MIKKKNTYAKKNKYLLRFATYEKQKLLDMINIEGVKYTKQHNLVTLIFFKHSMALAVCSN